MTQKALYAVLVSLGLIAGGGMTFAHYAAAESLTNTPAVASTGTNAIISKEESDVAEKTAEQNMTPTQIQAKESAEGNSKDDEDKNEVGERSSDTDKSEMNDAAESSLTPEQKAAHDKAERSQENGKDDQETND